MSEPESTTIDTRPGWGHAEDLVPIVAGYANRDAANIDVRTWATRALVDAGVPRDDVEGAARALLDAVKRDVRYTDDPVFRKEDGTWDTHELVQSPRYTLKERAGDCMAITSLLGAALQSVGQIPRYVVISERLGTPRHIAVEVQTPRGWLTLDPVPTPERFGVDARVVGAETKAWSAGGFQVPMGAVCCDRPDGGLGAVGWNPPPGAIRVGSIGETTEAERQLESDMYWAEQEWDAAIAGLESKYDSAINTYGGAVRDGVKNARVLFDSGSSPEEVLHAISGTIATAGAIVAAAVPVVGWIVGAVAAIAAAICEAVNWLLSAWPAQAVSTTECGMNLALRDLGYSTQDMNSRSVLNLDTAALAMARADGWVFFPFEGGLLETRAAWNDQVRILRQLCAKEVGDLNATLDACRTAMDAVATSTEAVSTEACGKVGDHLQRGWSRFNYLFGSVPTPGAGEDEGAAPRPTIVETSGELRTAEAVTSAELEGARALDPEGGQLVFANAWAIRERDWGSVVWEVHAICWAFRLDAMPGEMARAVRAGLIAPEGEWPDDIGVRAVLRQIRGSDPAGTSKHLLKYALEWAAREIAEDKAPLRVAGRAAHPVRMAPAAMLPRHEEPAEEPTQVLPPTPEPAPAAAPQLPPAFPEGLSTQEATVLAAIRYQAAVQDATHADAAARAFYGMAGIGAGSVRFVDAAAEAEIAATLGTAAALVARTDVKTRAAQVNYALQHVNETRAGRRTLSAHESATRIMAWKKASESDPVDSVIDDQVRAWIAEDAGIGIGAVPTVGDIAAKLGAGITEAAVPAGAVMVAPAGTLPPTPEAPTPEAPTPEAPTPEAPAPTPSGLPAARVAVLPREMQMQRPVGLPAGPTAAPEGEAATSPAFPAGAPSGAVMISPPGTADITVRHKPDQTTIAFWVLLVYFAARRKR